MINAMKLIIDFAKKGHPLGLEIDRVETPKLIKNLRVRLDLSPDDLDLSPLSLMIMEEKLLELAKELNKNVHTEEEIVEIIREIAAYFGEVLVLHADGIWDPRGSLWNTLVVFKGKIKIYKGKGKQLSPSIVYSLGNIASSALEAILLGKQPNLYDVFLSAKKKSHVEKL